MTVPYTDVKVGDTVSKTLYFKAKSVADAAYERITVGVYDVSKSNGQITEEGRLGEKRVYVLLPGNDGNLPKVTFPSVSSEIIYSSGTRHLYAAVTNSAMLDDAANWNIFAESDAHGKKIAIPHGNISIKDGVMDIAITDNEDISGLGDWRIVFEWTDAAVSAGIVRAGTAKRSPRKICGSRFLMNLNIKTTATAFCRSSRRAKTPMRF